MLPNFWVGRALTSFTPIQLTRMLPESLARLRSYLATAAREHRVVTYGELMSKYHLSRGPALSGAIGEVDRLEREEGRLGFAAIVVRKDTGFPGGGYFCDDTLPSRLRRPRSLASDPRLSRPERRHIRRLQHEIWAFYSQSRDGALAVSFS